MLYFIEESTAENAKANEECQVLYEMLEEIKHSREVGVDYMKWVETVHYERKEERKQAISVLKAHLAGMSDKQIAEKYGYDMDSVQEVISDYENA